MFKLPDGIPSLRTSAQDWADYAEYLAWRNKGVSVHQILKTPLMVSDEIDIDGVEDDTDRLNDKADEIVGEIRNRIRVCNGRYPFEIFNNDYSISYSPPDTSSDLVYRYLLLATRVNMSRNRIHDGIDGTLLFERLCAVVATKYFGDKAQTETLGTSKSSVGGFRTKLKELIAKLGEGESIHQNEGHQPQDENVDIVVWKGFTDRLPSQMIAFGQCKTGTSWSDRLSELNTEAFCGIWFTRQPVLTPVRMFFCAQYFPREIWYVRAKEAGLVFDRFRILDYLPPVVDDDLLRDIARWTDAAFKNYNP